jgi:hypothetical protein
MVYRTGNKYTKYIKLSTFWHVVLPWLTALLNIYWFDSARRRHWDYTFPSSHWVIEYVLRIRWWDAVSSLTRIETQGQRSAYGTSLVQGCRFAANVWCNLPWSISLTKSGNRWGNCRLTHRDIARCFEEILHPISWLYEIWTQPRVRERYYLDNTWMW